MLLFIFVHATLAHNQVIPQENHYKNVNFNLEAEPLPDIYDDSDDDEITPSKELF